LLRTHPLLHVAGVDSPLELGQATGSLAHRRLAFDQLVPAKFSRFAPLTWRGHPSLVPPTPGGATGALLQEQGRIRHPSCAGQCGRRCCMGLSHLCPALRCPRLPPWPTGLATDWLRTAWRSWGRPLRFGERPSAPAGQQLVAESKLPAESGGCARGETVAVPSLETRELFAARQRCARSCRQSGRRVFAATTQLDPCR